ncbi:endonuclease domain-containing protein [Streptomyces reniochalinae]|uniref:endonuclease domain-containing protein n=1 Tax=Streptomyces reniochalinae TaxID=2250578 RepID=UPI003CCC827F
MPPEPDGTAPRGSAARVRASARQSRRPCPEHVEHDHEPGKVRGVPCFSRDAALGHLEDRPDARRRAAAYVEGNVWKPKFVAPGVYLLPS